MRAGKTAAPSRAPERSLTYYARKMELSRGCEVAAGTMITPLALEGKGFALSLIAMRKSRAPSNRRCLARPRRPLRGLDEIRELSAANVPGQVDPRRKGMKGEGSWTEPIRLEERVGARATRWNFDLRDLPIIPLAISPASALIGLSYTYGALRDARIESALSIFVFR